MRPNIFYKTQLITTVKNKYRFYTCLHTKNINEILFCLIPVTDAHKSFWY